MKRREVPDRILKLAELLLKTGDKQMEEYEGSMSEFRGAVEKKEEWTPSDIEILLHYHTRSGDFADNPEFSPAKLLSAELLVGVGMMPQSAGSQKYRLTPRGTAFLTDGVLSTPLPVAAEIWVMP